MNKETFINQVRETAKQTIKGILNDIKRPELEDVTEDNNTYNHHNRIGLFIIEWTVNEEKDVVIGRIRYDGTRDPELSATIFEMLQEIGEENGFGVDWS